MIQMIPSEVTACKALREIGEKAGTTEVINRLLPLLGDTRLIQSDSSACVGSCENG